MENNASTTGTATTGTDVHDAGTAGPEVPLTGTGPSDAGPAAAADPGAVHPGPGAGAPYTTGAPHTTGAPSGGAGTRTAAQGIGDRVAAFRLRRSSTDRMLGGVCGGLATDLGADAALLRIAVLVLTLFTGGAAALVYLAAWLIAPAA
ncbi:PspC domain-containing protein [Pseudonocardia tropica]|uniref:PspC domain-containing protein n=1 Tax=Pseudonocardia tropica TaxID=681289 RepID=A0ABV1JVK3_9PSEU